MNRLRTRVFLVALPAVLAVLLILLAALQYRWSGELSAGERRRMEAALRSSVAAMARLMNEEFSRAAASMAPEPAALEMLDGRALAASWNRWSATSISPELIRDLHLVRVAETGPEIYRLIQSAGELEPFDRASLPPPLLRAVEADIARGGLDQRIWLDADSATLIARVVELPVISAASGIDVADIVRQIQTAPRARLRGYVIARIDFDVLRTSFMPELVSRYVPDADYRIALLRSSDQTILYSSGEASFESPDAVAGVIPPSTPPMVVSTRGATSTATDLLRGGAVSVLRSAAGEADASAAPWELRAVHRAGSLDVAVDQSRRRSLVLGFSVLLILASGIALAFMHIRRADELARQQMEFVSVMSHELRTPIAIVAAAAENLSAGLVRSETREREYGNAIGREAARLATMVEQVLEFARAPAGRAYVLETIDLASIARESMESMRPLIADAGGSIEGTFDSAETLVRGDAAALGRAVRNLIANAMQHGGPGPAITVAISSTPKEATLTVRDSGPGIPAAEQSHLTEPFFRGSRAIDLQIPGSGLGLAIVQRIVDAHGGRLTVQNLDPGAAFSICIRRDGS
ncbi:MAG TPA: HAMP domain-containing sensor histidine kinase [Thermoanaerobaculia bacterium]